MGGIVMQTGRSRVVLTCGVGGTGKSTFARQLEAAGYVRLSVDEEVRKRLESGVLTPDADVRLVSISIEEDIRAQLVDLVRQGKDVVVDYSFWKRSARDAYRRLVTDNGGLVELVYFRRASAGGVSESAEGTGAASLDRYIPDFEVPTDDEHPIVIDAFAGANNGAG